jgi:predicted lipoprotein with Yx(FWY)xxD motif
MLRTSLRLAGAGLLATTAAIHLDLYLTGYRSIPTIGWLFLLQVIAAFALAAAVLATAFARGDGLVPRLVAAAGAGFAIATLGGYLLSLWIGLFGFREVRTTAGTVAGVIEVAAFAALAVAAAAPAPRAARAGSAAGADAAARPAGDARPGPGPAGMRAVLAAAATLSLIALAVLGGSVAAATSAPAASSTPAPGTPAVLKTATIGGVTVLTNAKGFTLYWFAPDTSARSVCYGTCAVYWPPVTGSPVAGPGVTGRIGTISRTGGGTEVTYDGHPLYTYVGDTAPGRASGNNLDLNGGLWHEVTVAG